MQVVDPEQNRSINDLHVFQVRQKLGDLVVRLLLLRGEARRIDVLDLLGVSINDDGGAQLQSVLVFQGSQLLIQGPKLGGIFALELSVWIEMEEALGLVEVLGPAQTLKLMLIVHLVEDVDEVCDELPPVFFVFGTVLLLAKLALLLRR